jgi:hypothetical protein
MSKHLKGKSLKPKRPKTKLGLPDLDHSKSAVLDSLSSHESKRVTIQLLASQLIVIVITSSQHHAL